MYYLLLLSLLVSNIDSFINDFSNVHSSFLKAPIKKIEFDYSINNSNTINSDGLIQLKVKMSNQGQGTILMDNNNYKLLLDNYIILSNSRTMKTYNKQTNQIFIEDSIFELDSLILDLFNNLENNFSTIDSNNNYIMIGDKKNKIKIFINDNSISLINWTFNDLIGDISAIKLSEYINDRADTLFTINKKDVFILDLRD